MTVKKRTPFVEQVAEAPRHAASLYAFDRVAESLPGLAAVGRREIERYEREGFLAVEGVLSEDEIEAARGGLVDLIGQSLSGDGAADVMLEAASGSGLEKMGAKEKIDAVRKVISFCGVEPRLRALSEHEGIVGVVRQLMGGCEPVCFQEMALLKPPRIGREKPWHQDTAYFRYGPETPVVGVWIAVDRATPENGCMHVLPGTQLQGPVPHFKRRDWQICDAHVREHGRVAVPLGAGGLMFFSGLLHHGTPHNDSPMRRWAVQYHYAPSDARAITEEERLAIFGGEGRGVEC
ncbi:MAG: phytanoyl-CoA dioxygenase family protein [Phycisphaeraceae bacterium]|nr:phytanoyl-CoA dioxygenase family protein [Phycisphaeraceae bacterium]